jgi:hypothetical protein
MQAFVVGDHGLKTVGINVQLGTSVVWPWIKHPMETEVFLGAGGTTAGNTLLEGFVDKYTNYVILFCT